MTDAEVTDATVTGATVAGAKVAVTGAEVAGAEVAVTGAEVTTAVFCPRPLPRPTLFGGVFCAPGVLIDRLSKAVETAGLAFTGPE